MYEQNLAFSLVVFCSHAAFSLCFSLLFSKLFVEFFSYPVLVRYRSNLLFTH